MKEYRFPDTDKEGYEIIIPNNVTKDIIRDYLQKTYYWSIALGSFIIGFLAGVMVS
jgi:hypothetical protein